MRNAQVIILSANDSASATGNAFLASLFKNGSLISRISGQAIQTTSSISPAVNGSGDIYLLAGDYVDLRVGHQEGTNRVLQNIASLVHFEGKLIK